MADNGAHNAFVRIDDRPRARQLADALSSDLRHCMLDGYAGLCCPVADTFGQPCNRGVMQVEYATDPPIDRTRRQDVVLGALPSSGCH